jgi:uncharacterized protein YdcH (DUF465 family)
MESLDQDILERLIEEDGEFKKIYQTHREYDQKIKKFDKKAGLTPYEETERKRLQKLKLTEKDRMEAAILEYRNREGGEGEKRQDKEG